MPEGVSEECHIGSVRRVAEGVAEKYQRKCLRKARWSVFGVQKGVFEECRRECLRSARSI